MRFVSLAAFVVLLAAAAAQQHSATRLRVEYLENPLGIDVAAPRFSYALLHSSRAEFQTVYDISVSSGGASVWDSGKVTSNVTTNIVYGGPALKSDADYTWTVTWWDSTGAASTPVTGTFSTGLYTPADWQGAALVGGANMLRGEFTVAGTGVTRARLYIVGLGYYRSWLNNEPTDAHVLGTFTTFQQRILYDAWDVTAQVQPGCNALGVLLGGGWYAQDSINAGPRSLQVLLSVTTSAGTQYFASALAGQESAVTAGAASPLTFSVTQGPVLYDDIYNGEVYDANLEQAGFATCSFTNGSAWAAATSVPSQPNAVLSWHTVPIIVDEVYSPVAITQPVPGTFVVDFGQNMAGQITTNVVCAQGSQWIGFWMGESLQSDGMVLNQYGSSSMRANFTCQGTGNVETYTTLFSYYGFRFAQITNWPGVPDEASFSAQFTHSAVTRLSGFNTNNEALNKIQHCHVYASLSNLMDVPTDCPQRERRGWLGDAQLSTETTISNFDMAAFYTKFLRDIRDSQLFYTPTNHGQIPDCVPFYGHGGLPADPAWSAAYPLITNWVSSYYNDDTIIAEQYVGIKAFMDSQTAQLNAQGVLSFARYGDWCSVSDGAGTGCGFTRPDISTFYYIYGLNILADFATRLGNTADATFYSSLSTNTSALYNKLWYNAAGQYYQDGYLISQVLALQGSFAGSNAPAVFNTVLNLFANGNHSGLPNAPSGGIVFMKYAFAVLSEYGKTDYALQVMLNQAFPSFSSWINDVPGATTLWENWQSNAQHPYGSYNHIMYGGSGAWFYNKIAGLGRVSGSAGWTNLLIAPPSVLLANVSTASASIDTPIGLASVAWTTDISNGQCGTAAENSNLVLTCAPLNGKPGTFTSVKFASFGTPTGGCPTFNNGTCNSPNSVSVATSLCLGKSSCTIPATNAQFGGDPCLNTLKQLSVSLGGNCGSAQYQLSVVVPVGAVAKVLVPTFGNAPAQAAISESAGPVWANGAFVPGVAGVTAAVAQTDAAGASVVALSVGSGTYVFTMSG